MDLIKQIRNSANPMQTFNLLKQSNPLMQDTQRLIDMYGNGDPKAAVYAMAKERGVDPSSILSQLGLT